MRLRPPAPADLNAVLDVILARDVADLGAPDYTREDLEADWSRGGWDLARDAVVVEDGDGRLLGYGEVHGRRALGLVHPEAEGRGIGTALARWLLERPGPLEQQVVESAAPARALLEAHGWERTWSFWRLGVELAGVDVSAAPPAGVALRAPRLPEDGPAL